MVKKELSASLEDYLEAIYRIAQRNDTIRVNRLTEFLQVGKSSVSWALKQLSQKKFINHTPYEGISLTEKGRIIGEQLAGRHEEIKTFLTDVLSVDETVAEENACRMEHILDKEVVHWMRQFMEFMDNCPRAGRQWLKGFGYFCEHGKRRNNCKRCISECLEDTSPALDIQRVITEELPKLSKRRDKTIPQRLKKVLKEGGRELTAEQSEVIDQFMSTEKHLPLENILRESQRRHLDISLEDTEEAMRILCEHKIARELRFGEQTVYEHYHPESHHDHIFCVICGSIVEFFDPRIEELQAENADRADFRLLTHTHNIYGVCYDCLRKEKRVRTLNECLAGEAVRIKRITSDAQTRRRLEDMGLVLESILEVVSEQSQGRNMILMLETSRLTLDHKTARKISVVPVDKQLVATLPPQGRRARHRHKIDKIFKYPERGRIKDD